MCIEQRVAIAVAGRLDPLLERSRRVAVQRSAASTLSRCARRRLQHVTRRKIDTSGEVRDRSRSSFANEAKACTHCHDYKGKNLRYVDPVDGCAEPVLAKAPTARLGVLVLGEAPNYDDTFDKSKGYLTYDKLTDPTGRFMRTLLIEEAGLATTSCSPTPSRAYRLASTTSIRSRLRRSISANRG